MNCWGEKMFRSFFVYLSQASWARNLISKSHIAKQASSRFVAGEELEQAMNVVKMLNQKGFNATLDHLGEHTSNTEKAKRATDDILAIIDTIENSGLKSNISIKLTQIGLAIDKNLCEKNIFSILNRAKEAGNFVRIDMEDSPWVDSTLDLYWKMRNEYNFHNVGVVIQAYLYRSETDIRSIVSKGGKVRLCKGAYKEPASIAFPKKKDVDENFDKIAKIIIDAEAQNTIGEIGLDGKIPPICAVGTHDPDRIDFAVKHAESAGLSKKALEFQMLYGIRRDLQDKCLTEGYPVRIYVPYGTEWYPYFTRRLAERPANLWFFLTNLFRN
jgi:proline dehydrogenase